MTDLRSTMDVVFHATAHTFKHTDGAAVFEFGDLRGYHYDDPLWWETDSFQVIDMAPRDAVGAIQSYGPGPHLIGVVTTDPESVIPPYGELGYKTVPEEPLETVMAMNLSESVPTNEQHPVQLVRTEKQRLLFNSAIEPDDPHGQMRSEELEDPVVSYYLVEKDGQCVCNGKVISPFPTAITVEPLATHPGYRRRGIATSLMNRVHADAVDRSVKQSVIVASVMGVPLYTTLGYHVVAYIQKFVPEGWVSSSQVTATTSGEPLKKTGLKCFFPPSLGFDRICPRICPSPRLHEGTRCPAVGVPRLF